ncbi:MAG TPA: SRPBCC family protein [Frankiaceae bacterium]|nr:SRPBCC family protein [Frankiaceae bacterium]
MVTFRNEIDIDASPEAVFDELSDVRHEQRWSDKLKSVELLTPEPIGVGSRVRAKWSGAPENDVVYREFDRPRRWVTESRSWMLVVEVDLQVEPSATGSRLLSTWSLKPRGPVRLLTPVLKKAFDKDVAANMRAAKAHVEQLTRH